MTAWANLDADGYFTGGQEYPSSWDKKVPAGVVALPEGARLVDYVGMRLVNDEWVEDALPGLEPEDPAAVKAAAKQAAERVEAQNYLASTDWYTARLIETGKPIPEDVSAKRAAARITLDVGE